MKTTHNAQFYRDHAIFSAERKRKRKNKIKTLFIVGTLLIVVAAGIFLGIF